MIIKLENKSEKITHMISEYNKYSTEGVFFF